MATDRDRLLWININKNYIKLQCSAGRCYAMIVTHPLGIKIELALISAPTFNCFFLFFRVRAARLRQIRKLTLECRNRTTAVFYGKKRRRRRRTEYDLTLAFTTKSFCASDGSWTLLFIILIFVTSLVVFSIEFQHKLL